MHLKLLTGCHLGKNAELTDGAGRTQDPIAGKERLHWNSETAEIKRRVKGLQESVSAHFGLVRIVWFGSSTSLLIPEGAGSRKEDSCPSAKTRPISTSRLPAPEP